MSVKVVSRLWRLATGLETQRLLLSPESLPVNFVVDKVALLQDLFRSFRVSPVSIISPSLHTHLYQYTDLARKTNGQNLETFTHQFCLGKEEVTDREAKCKSVPLQAWSGPECSRKLRLPDFVTTAQDGGKVVSLTHRPPLPPGNNSGTHFC